MLVHLVSAQGFKAEKKTLYAKNTEGITLPDSSLLVSIDTATYTIQLPEVPILSWRSKDEQMEYYKSLSRIRKVIPYVKIARALYHDLQEKKNDEKKKRYRAYRKDLEKEMREQFEKELKNLSIGQGQVLVKLINRETGNNCYDIIKEIKGGFSAWGWQIVAKHYDYDLKEKYDPQKEWILELAIKNLGKEYDVSTAYDIKKQ